VTFCDENVTSLTFVPVTHSKPGLGSGIFWARKDPDNSKERMYLGLSQGMEFVSKKNVWSSTSVLLPTDGTSSPSLATVHPLSRKFQFSANERPANGSDKCAALRLCVLISTCHPLASLLEEDVRLLGAGSRPARWNCVICHSVIRLAPHRRHSLAVGRDQHLCSAILPSSPALQGLHWMMVSRILTRALLLCLNSSLQN